MTRVCLIPRLNVFLCCRFVFLLSLFLSLWRLSGVDRCAGGVSGRCGAQERPQNSLQEAGRLEVDVVDWSVSLRVAGVWCPVLREIWTRELRRLVMR